MSQRKKILVLAANPRDTSRLRLDQEVREINIGLQRSKRRDFFELNQIWAVRPRDLRQALLDDEPQILHFCGHGLETGGLCLENEQGKHYVVNPEAITHLFELCSSYVECVVLNACYSEIQAESISKHIDYVIGMNQGIGDKAAIEFAVGFYDALGAGRNIEDAYRFGCNALELEGISEYFTPKLKIRGRDKDIQLTSQWDNEAYVSLHLVQEVLEQAGLPRKSLQCHWYPQFRIKTKSVNKFGNSQEIFKPVDFLIEDVKRDIKFLIEVKSAKNKVDDSARFQLRSYLQQSKLRHGVLIDPFKLEIYEFHDGRFKLKEIYDIGNPEHLQPVAMFLKNYLDSISDAYNCDSYV
ncbi:MAG: CHAT domain-containing protein [Elainellaceae cyanobacterium]